MRRRRRRAGVFEQRRVVDGGPPRRVLRAMRLRGRRRDARGARRRREDARRRSLRLRFCLRLRSREDAREDERGARRGDARERSREEEERARERRRDVVVSPRALALEGRDDRGGVRLDRPRRSVEHGRGRDDVRERDREPDAPQFPRARHPRPRVGAAGGAVETSVTRDVSPRGDARVEGVGGHRVRGAVAERRRRGGDVRVGVEHLARGDDDGGGRRARRRCCR